MLRIFSLVCVMFLLDLLWWWWAHRALASTGRSRWLLDAFMAMQFCGLLWIIGGRFFTQQTDEWVPRWMFASIFVWHFLLLPPASFLAIASAIAKRPMQSSFQISPARRIFLKQSLVAISPLAAFAATGVGLEQLRRFRIQRMQIALPQLPAALDGLTIAHVSDIHVGRLTQGKVLDKLVQETNALDADLILFTGDLINHSLADLPVGVDVLRQMRSRFGTILIEGNHDLIEDRSVFESGIKASGIKTLINEETTMNIRGVPVQFLGLRWGGLGMPGPASRGDAAITQSMRELLVLRNPNAFTILMAHHPHAFDSAVEAKIPLTLAGHTHGGQINATHDIGFGSLMFRYWSGLYRRGESQLVVSNGVGNWFPLRINAPAELIHLTLRRA